MLNFLNLNDIKSSGEFSELIFQARAHLNKGNILIFPTDTVFGILCKDSNKIFEIKERPKTHFVQILCTKNQALEMLSTEYLNNEIIKKILFLFWPGGVSFIIGTKGMGIQCLRVPKNSLLLDILENSISPIFASSLNIHKQSEIWTIDEIQKFAKGSILTEELLVFFKDIKKTKSSSVIELKPENTGFCTVTFFREGEVSAKIFEQKLLPFFKIKKMSSNQILIYF